MAETLSTSSWDAADYARVGGFVPALGDSFTLINNDGSDVVNGTFAGLPEGATLSNFLGSGRNAFITYAGGSNNNDVVVFLRQPTSTTLMTSPNPAGYGEMVTLTATVPSVPIWLMPLR